MVSGKGGVGRSTVSASLGALAASMGRRTLVCEADARGDVATLFEVATPSFVPALVEPNLWAMTMDTEASLQEYLRLHLRLPSFGGLGPLARMFDFLATAAPGVREILTMGKIAWEVRERHYDLVVVDAAASGHIVAQLGAPNAIKRLVAGPAPGAGSRSGGPLRDQTQWVADLLADRAVTGLVVVTTSEETPVNETIELIRRVGDETDVGPAAVIVNRVLPELFSRSDEETFARLSAAPVIDRLAELVEGPVGPALEVAQSARRLRQHRVGHLNRLRSALDPTLAMALIPELFAPGHGRRLLYQVTEALRQELT